MSNLITAIPGAIAQGLIWGIMAIGVYLTFKVLNIADLTVDGSICTGAAVCTMLMINGMNPICSMLLAFIAGAIAGTLTGLLNVLLGIPEILSGIITQMILWSLNLKILGKANQALSARTYNVILSQMNNGRAIIVLLIFTAILVAILYWYFGTEIGSAIRSTGSNSVMSRALGIDTNKCKVLGLAISNGIVALSGSFLCQYQGFTDINMGRGAIVTGLAAVVIGTALEKLLPNNFAVKLSIVSIGAVIYFFVYQLIISMGIDTDLLKMFSAIVVAVFLGIPYLNSTVKQKIKRNRG